MSNSTFIEEKQTKSFWQERYEELHEKYEQLLKSKDVEYIRKDALLDLVKSQKARLKQGYKHEWKNNYILFGGMLALDNLIEKIESL